MRPVPCAGYPVPSFHACLEYGVKDEDGLWRILLWALLDADGTTTLGACYEWKTGTGYGDMFTGTQTREPRPMFAGTQTRGPIYDDPDTGTHLRGPTFGNPSTGTDTREVQFIVREGTRLSARCYICLRIVGLEVDLPHNP